MRSIDLTVAIITRELVRERVDVPFGLERVEQISERIVTALVKHELVVDRPK